MNAAEVRERVLLSDDAKRKQLRAMGFSDRQIDAGLAGLTPHPAAPRTQAPPPETITLWIPWSCLVSDNERHRRPHAHSKRYVEAKAAAHAHAATQWGARAMIDGPVATDTIVYPPNRREPDAGNFRKCLLDALEGVCYANDKQVKDERWRLGPVMTDRPGAAVTIEAIR